MAGISTLPGLHVHELVLACELPEDLEFPVEVFGRADGGHVALGLSVDRGAAKRQGLLRLGELVAHNHFLPTFVLRPPEGVVPVVRRRVGFPPPRPINGAG
jgi:hypothetical protein